MKRVIIVFFFLLIFCKKEQISQKVNESQNNIKVPQKYIGNYVLEFNSNREYAPNMTWVYNLTIKRDSCIYELSGFQVHKKYYCYAKERFDTLYIYGLIDKEYNIDNIKDRLIFKLIKKNNKFYTIGKYNMPEPLSNSELLIMNKVN
jgi:hypothetical protein